MSFDIFPAIDIRGGRVVRLHQGDYGQEKVYGDDPVAVALRFVEAGASWIHVVDLDAARTGEPINRDLVSAVTAAVGDVRIQSGGGVRDEKAALALLDAGVARVVIGTAAVTDPELVASLAASRPGSVAVGLDHRDGEVAIRGWTERSGQTVAEMAGRLEDQGASALIVTNIATDGALVGPDVAGLSEVLSMTGLDVIASGGVGSLADVEALAAVDVAGRSLAGVIVGRALYEGRITLGEALACAR